MPPCREPPPLPSTLDGTNFDPTKVSVKSTGGIPVGTVITWPSNSWPSDADNWLECNGQSISSTVYPELVARIGATVPNYQGVFLRGYGSQTSYHYGVVGHWSAGLGELQGDTIRNITGTHSSEVLMVGATNTYGTTEAFYDAGSSGGRQSKAAHLILEIKYEDSTLLV